MAGSGQRAVRSRRRGGKARLRPGGRSPPAEGAEAPRVPAPAASRTGVEDLFDAAARRLGCHPFPASAGIRSHPYHGLPACDYHGSSTGVGCHANAKAGPHLRVIPQAEATGNLKVVMGARVTSIETEGSGRVTGVAYVEGNTAYFQPARVVLLAAFTYENIRLLLLSRSRAYLDGSPTGPAR